ncbi:MAG: serine/threonine protein kinase [Deltaproteobacteria bacterium]|nr:serine/threonine protein kinase [Deltaproteobacteria bacterium]
MELSESHESSIEVQHKILRHISSGSKTSSYVAEDRAGNLVTLTYLERDKIIQQHKMLQHYSGLSLEEAEKKAITIADDYRERFFRAAERVGHLAHDHVAGIVDQGYDEKREQCVVITEYAPGVDFFYATQGLTELQQITLFAQALEGLDFIHQSGFLHLNVKPKRVRVNLDHTPPWVKFTDFGLAIPKKAYSGIYSGTALYMAPEVVMGENEQIDDRADLYSFGIMAYYALTRHHPLEHRLRAENDRQKLKMIVGREGVMAPPSQYRRSIPTELDAFCIKLIQKNPTERGFSTAAAALKYLRDTWPEASKSMPTEMTTTLVA